MKNRILRLLGAAVLAAGTVTAVAASAPAQAATCHVAVTHGPHYVQGKRYAGTCRFDVRGVFNFPGQNGVHETSADATTGYATIYEPGGNYSCCAGWGPS